MWQPLDLVHPTKPWLESVVSGHLKPISRLHTNIVFVEIIFTAITLRTENTFAVVPTVEQVLSPFLGPFSFSFLTSLVTEYKWYDYEERYGYGEDDCRCRWLCGCHVVMVRCGSLFADDTEIAVVCWDTFWCFWWNRIIWKARSMDLLRIEKVYELKIMAVSIMTDWNWNVWYLNYCTLIL